MKKSIPLLITAFVFGVANVVSAHEMHTTTKHHCHLHAAAHKVARGEATAEQAAKEMLNNPEHIDAVKKDIAAHAQDAKKLESDGVALLSK